VAILRRNRGAVMSGGGQRGRGATKGRLRGHKLGVLDGVCKAGGTLCCGQSSPLKERERPQLGGVRRSESRAIREGSRESQATERGLGTCTKH